MGWKTVVIGTECKVSLSMNRMKVTIGEEYYNYSLTDIDTVIFTHNRVCITTPLISKLIENNIGIIMCDDRNDPIGIFLPFNGHSVVFRQLKKQMNWKITRKKRLWKTIVEEKIKTEIDVLDQVTSNCQTVEMLKVYHDSVYNDDQTNREGSSARVYFKELFGEEFTRESNTVVNIALNYGYKILASYISKCIAARGYLTQLGVHHIGESNPFNLTYDFIETFRAIIDLWVFNNIADQFNTSNKLEIIRIMEYKVNLGGKWIRLNDAIEDVVDSYFAFLNEEKDKVLVLDLSKGIRSIEE